MQIIATNKKLRLECILSLIFFIALYPAKLNIAPPMEYNKL